MALDIISAVEEAENNAAKIRSDAQTEASAIIAKAEADGKAAIENAKKMASEQVLQISRELDLKADDEIKEITSETENKRQDLEGQAFFNMDAAAKMIKERIVKG